MGAVAAVWSISSAFVGGASLRGSSRSSQVGRRTYEDGAGFNAPGFYYEKNRLAYIHLEYNNNVGYLPDGTAMNLAGNAVNHPETIAPDTHTPGSALPTAALTNTVGYLP